MTDELRQKANRLHSEIEDIRKQITLVEAMHHSDNSIHIYCKDVGEIVVNEDEELKDDIIDIVLGRLNRAKEDKEDEYRML